ncbi:MAG: S8 family serine peptidase, partial [Planctomycetota bacterium]
MLALLTIMGITWVPLASAAPTQAIPWRAGPVELEQRSPAEIADTLQSIAAVRANSTPRVVVQFTQPVNQTQRAALAANGLNLLNYVGANAYFATISAAQLDVNAISQTTLVAVEPVRLEWKLHPMLNAGLTADWAQVGTDANGTPIVGAYLLFHPDVNLMEEGLDLMQAYDINVRDMLESINGLVIELSEDLIPILATEDAVLWIEPPLPEFSVNNDSCRSRMQVNQVQASPYNLDGAGVTVLVYDGGTARATHVDFQGRLTVHDYSGMHYHSTHVAGTVGGAGVANSTYTGMAPGATLLSYGFQYSGTGIFLYSNPGDIESDYSQAINTYGADIANNSIGTNTATNGFPCEITGDYGVTANLIDTIVRGDPLDPDFGQPFRIVWANGNERQTTRCGDTYNTTAPPACAKNHITVGALNSDTDGMTSFSSWGPTDDGRIKPDISGPGCQSGGDGGVTSCDDDNDTDYTTLCGTSMASPSVCGSSALLLQDYRAQFAGSPDPRNSTLKALLAHSAVDLGNTGPDYQYGYGSVRIKDAIDLMRTGAFVERSIGTGATYTVYAEVSPGDPELKVTLAWDDYPATPNAGVALVNDLDLRVFSPTMARLYPWTLNPNNPSAAATRDSEDHINNIEQVLVENPASGTWTIEVHGHNVPEGGQKFSLVGDGAVNAGIWIGYPNGLPDLVAPGQAPSFDVSIVTTGEDYVANSGMLTYRYDGGTWHSVPLVPLGGTLFRADLPAALCNATPEFYISAAGTVSGYVYDPPNAPYTTYSFEVGEYTVFMTDDFETNQGWTVENSGLTDGPWDRGIPVNCDRGDPPSDYDGSGQCYLTDNSSADSCNSDVDGGYTWLISPTIDLGDGDAEVSFALWYTNNYGGDPNNDLFVVWVSNNNGGSWIEVETIGPASSSGWSVHTFMVGDYVTPTAQVKVRFEASDLGLGSVVEAGIDAFTVSAFGCDDPFEDCNGNSIPDDVDLANCDGSPWCGDCNNNGILDICDLNNGSPDCQGDGIPDECQLVDNDCNNNGIPDECDIGNGSADCQPDGIPDECQLGVNDCNENGVPDDCDILMGAPDCQPDGIPDECQLGENDCNDNGFPDECDLAWGISQDCNENDVPDECDIANGTSEDVNGNGIPDECEQLDTAVCCHGYVCFDVDPYNPADPHNEATCMVEGGTYIAAMTCV